MDPDDLARQYMAAEPVLSVPAPVLLPAPTPTVPQPVIATPVVAAPVVAAPVVAAPAVAAPAVAAPVVAAPAVAAPVMSQPVVPGLAPTAGSAPETPEPAKRSWMSALTDESLQSMLASPAFRIGLTFVLVFVMLVVIRPSFIENRRERSNALERAPISYRRVLIFTMLAILLIVVIPIIWENQAALAAAFDRVRRLAARK